jgi:hypothetical protein
VLVDSNCLLLVVLAAVIEQLRCAFANSIITLFSLPLMSVVSLILAPRGAAWHCLCDPRENRSRGTYLFDPSELSHCRQKQQEAKHCYCADNRLYCFRVCGNSSSSASVSTIRGTQGSLRLLLPVLFQKRHCTSRHERQGQSFVSFEGWAVSDVCCCLHFC